MSDEVVTTSSVVIRPLNKMKKSELIAEVERLRSKNSAYFRAIWLAQSRVYGYDRRVSPFDDLAGAEESPPVIDSTELRSIILDLPAC